MGDSGGQAHATFFAYKLDNLDKVWGIKPYPCIHTLFVRIDAFRTIPIGIVRKQKTNKTKIVLIQIGQFRPY
jgi:hypothetical protein